MGKLRLGGVWSRSSRLPYEAVQQTPGLSGCTEGTNVPPHSALHTMVVAGVFCAESSEEPLSQPKDPRRLPGGGDNLS